MAFSNRSDTKRPPLRHRDLDALSDRELEALLFDGSPKKQRSWSVPKIAGSMAVGAWLLSALHLPLALYNLTPGDPMEVLALILLVVAAISFLYQHFDASSYNSCTHTSTSSCQLTRSASDRKLMGVCGGLADYLGIDATPVRLAFILGLLATGGPPMGLAYLLLAYALPSAPTTTDEERLRVIRES